MPAPADTRPSPAQPTPPSSGAAPGAVASSAGSGAGAKTNAGAPEVDTIAREVAALTPADVTGRLWDVHAIESGVSCNRLDWLEETLTRDASALDGIPIRVTWKALDHHDEVGTLRGAESARVGGKVVVRGQAEITDPQAQKEMLRAYRAGDPYELSIDTPIRAVEGVGPDGKRVQRVLAIRRTDRTELTIVKRGAAGGRLMRAVAGEGVGATAPVEPAAPTTTTTQATKTTQNEEETMSAIAANPTVQDPGAAERRANEAADMTAAAEKRAKEAEASETRAREAEKKMGEATARAEAAEKKALDAAAALEKRARESEFKALLTERLAAGGTRLPSEAYQRVRESFIDPAGAVIKVVEAKEIDAAIEKERAYVARVAESFGAGRIVGCGDSVEVGISSKDRLEAAMDGYFAGEDMPVRSKQKQFSPHRKPGASLHGFRRARESFDHSVAVQGSVDLVPRFRTLNEAAAEILNGGRPMKPQDILSALHGWNPSEVRAKESYKRARESLATTDLTEIFGDSIRRQMLAQTAMSEKMALIWRLASKVADVMDFRTNRRMRFGGYGLLSSVAQGGTYPTLTSPTDEEATYVVTKYGGLEDLTIEMVANDDQGLIPMIPKALSAAGIETLFQTILDVFRLNSTLSYDSAAIFDTSSNATASAFSKSTLNTGRKTMRQQSPYGDSTKKMGSTNLPKLWIGPADLEETATILFQSIVKVNGSTDTATETPNIHRGGEVFVVDYWTDSADCVCVADPSIPGINTLEVGFFGGQRVPELVVADAANVGARFTADKIQWKVYFPFGFAFLERKHFYGFSR